MHVNVVQQPFLEAEAATCLHDMFFLAALLQAFSFVGVVAKIKPAINQETPYVFEPRRVSHSSLT